jgi:hypothetical protein
MLHNPELQIALEVAYLGWLSPYCLKRKQELDKQDSSLGI